MPLTDARRTLVPVAFAVGLVAAAVVIGMLLWNWLGVMSAPIDIVAPLILVRLIRPARVDQPGRRWFSCSALSRRILRRESSSKAFNSTV